MMWKKVKIGSLGQVITGNTPLTSDREFYGGSYPFIKPTDMEIDRRYVVNWEENYSEKAYKKYKNSFIPKGSTGVVTIGTVGEKIFQANRACFTNQSVNVVIPDQNLYDNDFVYYLLKYNLPKVSNANPGTASGRHHVSKSNFCAITVNTPVDISVQKKIASILSAYDDLIENNLKRIKLLEELAQRTYEEWFVKFTINGEKLAINEETGLPDGWEIKKICDMPFEIIDGDRGVNYPNKKDFSDKGYCIFLNAGNIKNDRFYFDSCQYITQEKDNLLRKGKLKRNDIIVTTRGSVGFIAHYSLWNKRENIRINSGMIIIREKGISTNYLYQLFKSEYMKNQYLAFSSGSAQPQLPIKDLKHILCLLPEKEVLEKFDSKMENIVKNLENLEEQNHLLKEARDILLPRLMNGTIEVKE